MRMFRILLAVLMLAVFCASCQNGTPIKPRTNDGHKWRTAYFEGGPYIDYQMILSETIRSLMKLGWIEKAELPKLDDDGVNDLWKWLAKEALS